jgi:hypothetical protein
MTKEPRERFRPADLVHASAIPFGGHFFVNEYHVVDGDKRNA